MPNELPALQRDLRLIGLALAACEKSVQIIYERQLRPPEKRHDPWITRVSGQLLAAYGALEPEIERQQAERSGAPLRLADVTIAVAWHFTQQMLPEVVPTIAHPRLAAFSVAAEALPEFAAAPHGDGTVRFDRNPGQRSSH
jgi:hypothetical protein